MTSQLTNETSKFNMAGASAPLIDLIGSKDSDGVGGIPTFGPTFIEFNGVDGSITWTIGTSPINTANDYSIYAIISFPGNITGIISRFMGGIVSSSAPTILWNGTLQALHFNAGGTGNINLSVGQEIKDPDLIAIMVSHDASGNGGVIAFDSTIGVKNSGNFTYTGAPVNDQFAIGRGKNGNSEIKFHQELGFYTSFISETDCVDTVAALVLTNSAPTGSINSIIQRT